MKASSKWRTNAGDLETQWPHRDVDVSTSMKARRKFFMRRVSLPSVSQSHQRSSSVHKLLNLFLTCGTGSYVGLVERDTRSFHFAMSGTQRAQGMGRPKSYEHQQVEGLIKVCARIRSNVTGSSVMRFVLAVKFRLVRRDDL